MVWKLQWGTMKWRTGERNQLPREGAATDTESLGRARFQLEQEGDQRKGWHRRFYLWLTMKWSISGDEDVWETKKAMIHMWKRVQGGKRRFERHRLLVMTDINSNKNMMRLGLMVPKQWADAKLWLLRGRLEDFCQDYEFWESYLTPEIEAWRREWWSCSESKGSLLIPTNGHLPRVGLTPHCSGLSSVSYQWKPREKSYFLSISDTFPHSWGFFSQRFCSASPASDI